MKLSHGFHSLRYQLIAVSILVLLILFALVSFNTQRLLQDFALESTRNHLAQTSETLNLAVVPQTTEEGLKTLEIYLEALIVGDENGIIYLAVLDESNHILVSSQNTPNPLPIVNPDLAQQLFTGIVHAEQPILLADYQVGNLRYGLSTRLLKRTTAEILRKNLLLIAVGLLGTLLIFMLIGLRITRHIERLVKATQSLANGDYQARIDEAGKNELSFLAHNFNLMSDAVLERDTELRVSHLRYRDLVENTHDWIWEVDVEARYTYVSPRVKELLGYEPEDIIGKTPFDLMPEEEARKVADVFSEIMKQNISFNTLENINLHRDGHKVVLETSGTPIFDENGEFKGYRGTDRDITERKKFEVLNGNRERELSTIIDNLPNMLFVKEAKNLSYVRFNRAGEELLGVSREDMFGKNDFDLSPPAQAEFFTKIDREVLASGKLKNITEEPIETPNGTRVLHTSKVVIYNELGEPEYLLGISEDITDRKSAEEALKNSEITLRKERDFIDAVVEAAGSIIVVLDHQGCIVRFNHAAEQITGYRFEELHDKPIWDFLIPEEIRASTEGVFDNLVAGNIIGVYENEWIMKDGSRRMFDWRNTVLEDEQGNVSFVVSQGYDVTEIRATQQALAEHKNKLEQLVTERTAQVRQQARIISQSHDSIVTTDLEGHITSWNHGAEKLHGILEGDAIGQHISMLYPPDQLELRERHIIKPLMKNGQHEIDVNLWRADHSRFDAHLSLSLLYDDTGKPTGLVGYSVDITERKKMENALRESESNLAHAQAIAHIGSWYFDFPQNELRWSEETYRIFDIDSSTDIELERFVSSIHDDDKSRVLEAWELVLSGKPYDLEHRIIAGGKEKWVKQVAEVVFDSQGEAVSALGTTQDITELKQADLATQEALIEARRLVKVRSEFVANMSHEIRTPLNAVLGLANMGEKGRATATGNAQELFSRIKDSGQHLLRVVNDILDFSKIDAGKLRVESIPFKLATSVDNVVNMLTEQAKSKGLTLAISMSEDLPSWVLGDPMRLEQILVNLISNGIKFTEQGEIGLTVTSKNDNIYFSVSDTGVGLSSAEISQLFKPFIQGDSSSTRRFGGTGLGLSISQSLAKIMGGEISVKSQLHVGSEFILGLPLPAETVLVNTQQEPSISSETGRLKGLHILAAEDIEVNRLVLADLLGQEGAHVLFAENGLQAVELLEEKGVNAFDVVLMDIQMPKLDGYSASRQMLTLAPGLPIIGLTAHALAEEKAHCLAAGMVDHVAKPIDADALVMAILKNCSGISEKQASTDSSSFTDSVSNKGSIPGWESSEELIDWLALQNRFKGRDGFINKLLATMLKSQQDTPQKLRLAVQSEDIDQIYFQVHSLKSMAGNLQAGQLDYLARQTEIKIKENSQEALALALQAADVLEQVLQLIEYKIHD